MAGRGRGRGRQLIVDNQGEGQPTGLSSNLSESHSAPSVEPPQPGTGRAFGRGRGFSRSRATSDLSEEQSYEEDQKGFTGQRGRGVESRRDHEGRGDRGRTREPGLREEEDVRPGSFGGGRGRGRGAFLPRDPSQFEDTLADEAAALTITESDEEAEEQPAAQPTKVKGEKANGVPSEEFYEDGTRRPVSVPSSLSRIPEGDNGDEGEEQQEAAPLEPIIRIGVKGDPVMLETNFLKMRIAEGRGRHEYFISFEPRIDGAQTKREALKSLERTLGKMRTFDGGSQLFLPEKLPDEVFSVDMAHPNNPDQPLTIRFRYVKALQVDACIPFYNILFRKALGFLGYVEMGRKFFNQKGMINMSQNKMEIWPGLETAVQNYEGGLMLCVDVAHRILMQSTLYDYIREIDREQNYKERLNDYIIGRTVLTRYNNRTYKVDDISFKISPLSTFTRGSKEISYVDYFSQHYGLTLTDLKQPMVVSKIKARKNDPTGEDRLVVLAPELCHVTGLSDDIRKNHVLMRDIMGKTAMSPSQRIRVVKDFVATLKGHENVQELFNAWGLQVCARTTEVPGRIMKGPSLFFNERFSLKEARPDFSKEATSNPCFNPIELKKWIILCTPNDRDKAQRLLETYSQVVKALGIKMDVGSVEIVVVRSQGRPGPMDFKKCLREKANPNVVQFVVVILPQQRDDLYAAVKKQCLIESSIPSQVILTKTLMNEKRVRSVMQKVALQINCKLGGALWALNVPLKENIMFVGIDTHHDPRRKLKSVLAMVATLDTRCTQYYSRILFQAPHQESADGLKSLYTQGLAAYYEENKFYPDRVVVFRDGISDGQLDIIKAHEVVQLKSTTSIVCRQKVQFSYIVVQKRISERMFSKERNDLMNPQPGTVLDSVVTRRFLYDFFLVSQLVRQGTVTPSHYIVLDDSGENNPDLLQKLSFVLSFMYFNWPGSIRGPAMCQYAHKLAMLVGQHLQAEPMRDMEKNLYYL